MVAIYALRDPRSGEVRYVGKTAQPVWVRVRAHLYRAQRGERAYCARWLRGLLLDGLLPCIEVLEEVADDAWIEAERYWIAYYRERGNLCNLTEGGEGAAGRVVSPRERAARAASWTPELRELVRRRKAGKKSSPEAVAAIKLGLGRPEVRAKRQASMRQRWAEGRYADRPHVDPRRIRAEQFLRDALGAGPARSAEVKAAARAAGIGTGSLKGARLALGVRYEREDRRGQVGQRGSYSYWRLPEAVDYVV